jgi:hypothetical protein
MVDLKPRKSKSPKMEMDVRVIIRVAILMVLLLYILIVTQIRGDVVGSWYSEELNETWTFLKHGTLIDGRGNIAKYRVKGKRVYIDGEEDALSFKVMDDILILQNDAWEGECKFRRKSENDE